MEKIKVQSSLTGNKYSQWGEENALRQIFSVLERKTENLVHVEFGASHGTDNSNLFVFAEEGKRVVFIESDPKKHAVLEKRIDGLPTAQAVCAHVIGGEATPSNPRMQSRFVGTLPTILSRASVDLSRVGVVSIDIDGDDSAVFENLGINPLVVICEFNPTLPIDSIFRNPLGANFGNSPLELVRVATLRGMFPVAITHTNLIFVSNDLHLDFEEVDLVGHMSSKDFPRFGLGYDGTLLKFLSNGTDVTAEYYSNIWSHSFILQPLPRFLRGYSNRAKNFGGLLYTSLFAALLRPFLVVGVLSVRVLSFLRGRK
jgi:hypothetical protein